MPTYVYEVISEADQPPVRFEVVQGIHDEPLATHPETGEPVRRVLLPPNIGGRWSDGAMHRRVSDDKKLDRLGFTKYVKAGDGYYEKTAGKGPDVISRDKPIHPKDV